MVARLDILSRHAALNPKPAPKTFLKTAKMNDTTKSAPLPDRLSADPRSPHHVAELFEHDLGIRLNGKERVDVEEYCISEGWVKVPAGKAVDRKGKPLLIKLSGTVEVFYRVENK
jgi:Protein of unknown function (DUF3297)